MKAIGIARYGDNRVVKVMDVPAPQPGPGDLRIDVHAASINPVDFKIRDGKLKPLLPYKLPLILGNDLSGVVSEVGPRVTRFKAGDEVYVRLGKQRIGAFAEATLAREEETALKPRNLTHVEAASLPLVGLTAWQALVERCQLQAGQRVLIHAGAGGVGTFAIQLARHLGATVITTASARNADMVRELGAHHVVDYTRERFEDVARDCDAVFDTQGGETLMRSLECVKGGGVVVSIGGNPDVPTAKSFNLNPIIVAALGFMGRKITRAARRRNVRYSYLYMASSGEQLARITGLVEQGVIKPVVERTFPLDETAAALAHVEGGRTRGKVVLQVR